MGREGNLWLPHVYSPAQNPGDASGVNAYGRWAYGPWFWPPTNSIDHGPIANPYYDPACDPDTTWCEPPLMPGMPYNSMGMESFNDTPVVNGAAYPTLTLEPKAYRFRILNAANDRFFNLSLYQAVDANGTVCDATNTNPAPETHRRRVHRGQAQPRRGRGGAGGPDRPPDAGRGHRRPVLDPDRHRGRLPAGAGGDPGPADHLGHRPDRVQRRQRGQALAAGRPGGALDVVVDFSQYAGQTLIVYNDAPAAFPARDPRYDYYTGNADLRDSGGAPSTLPGYGPNTRTVMQIKVADTAPDTRRSTLRNSRTPSPTRLTGQASLRPGRNRSSSARGSTTAPTAQRSPRRGRAGRCRSTTPP